MFWVVIIGVEIGCGFWPPNVHLVLKAELQEGDQEKAIQAAEKAHAQ